MPKQRIRYVCTQPQHQCWDCEALFQLRAMSTPDPTTLADSVSCSAAPRPVVPISALTQASARVQGRKNTRGRAKVYPVNDPSAKYDDFSTPPIFVLFDSWVDAYSQDSQWSSVYKRRQKGEYVQNCALYKGKIRCKGKLVVPRCLVRAVIVVMHAYSHPGQRKLDVLCRRRFSFPFSPKKIIAEVVAQCPVCESCRRRTRPVPTHWSTFLSPPPPSLVLPGTLLS